MDATIGQKTWPARGGIIALALFALLAAAPTSQPAQQIRAWFDQLSDPDAQVREQATENLMGLGVSDLPILQKIVGAARPLRPSQKTVLREIVTHVYFAGISYAPNPADRPFVGLVWSQMAEESPDGLIVPRRVPGFAAYRMLRDGDLITGIEERPGESYSNPTAFGQAIRTFHSNQTITLHIQRDGKAMQVPIELRPQPLGIDDATRLEMWINEHQDEADNYWKKNFGPLIDDDVS